MKIQYYFAVLLIAHYMSSVHAVCCYTTKIEFVITNPRKKCSDYGAKKSYGDLVCETSICGDGKPLKKGVYCGIGPCNIFGCNCDGGCIPGNGRVNFIVIHGDEVTRVHVIFD